LGKHVFFSYFSWMIVVVVYKWVFFLILYFLYTFLNIPYGCSLLAIKTNKKLPTHNWLIQYEKWKLYVINSSAFMKATWIFYYYYFFFLLTYHITVHIVFIIGIYFNLNVQIICSIYKWEFKNNFWRKDSLCKLKKKSSHSKRFSLAIL